MATAIVHKTARCHKRTVVTRSRCHRSRDVTTEPLSQKAFHVTRSLLLQETRCRKKSLSQAESLSQASRCHKKTHGHKQAVVARCLGTRLAIATGAPPYESSWKQSLEKGVTRRRVFWAHLKEELAAWLCKGLPGVGQRLPQICENVLEEMTVQTATTCEHVGVVHLFVHRQMGEAGLLCHEHQASACLVSFTQDYSKYLLEADRDSAHCVIVSFTASCKSLGDVPAHVHGVPSCILMLRKALGSDKLYAPKAAGVLKDQLIDPKVTGSQLVSGMS